MKPEILKEKNKISINFSTRDGVPLFKRHSFFIDGGIPTFDKYTPELLELRSRTTRFSLPLITDSPASESYQTLMSEFMTEKTGFGHKLRQYTTPLWHVAFVSQAIPLMAQEKDPENAKWYEPEYPVWNNAWKTCAEYMAKRNQRSYYEVWNEPDQPFWTFFDWAGYIRLYCNTAAALREGDPDAVVGGPSMSNLNHLGEENFNSFLNQIAAKKVPLDYFSMHYYSNDPDSTLISELDKVKHGLSNEYFTKTQIIYTEFNVYTPVMGEWELPIKERTDFTLQKSNIIPKAFNAISELNQQTDVTQVQWAWLIFGNGSFALIDQDGNKSPLYHALHCYAHMPVGSVLVENPTKNIRIMASADRACAAVLIWNNSTEGEEMAELHLDDIPFDQYDVLIYRIDKNHSSYYETQNGDQLDLVEERRNCTQSSVKWKGTIPESGVVFISIKTDGIPELDQHHSVGDIIRVDHYFKDRLQNAYSDFDDLTSTAIIGTGSNQIARGTVAVLYRNIKDKIHVNGSLSQAIPEPLNDHSCLGIRLDYHTSTGYAKSVLYAMIAPADGNRVMPWGTQKAPDVIEKVNIRDFVLEIQSNAPENWDGQIIVTFDIENTGEWTEAVFKLY